MIKRIIFDIDYTLLIPNYYREREFFSKVVPKENDYFINHMYEILTNYERKYKKYDRHLLLKHLNQYLNSPLDSSFIDKWFKFNIELDAQDVSEAKDVLNYLSKYELVTLSNWFKEPQMEKLNKLGLLKYFQEFYGGDDFIKPYKESFLNACGNRKPSECIMIGDNLEADIIGAINAGLNAIHYTRDQDQIREFQKVKRLSELKKIL